MIRLCVTLIVAIYIILIVIPEPDHGEDVVARGDGVGQNWLLAMITDAEESAQAPRAPVAARAVQGNPLDRLEETESGFALVTADGERIEIAAVIDPVALHAEAGGDAVARVDVARVDAARLDEAPAAATDVAVAGAPVGQTSLAATLQPAGGPAVAAPEAPGNGTMPAGRIWRVAGDRVNFRAGPSTDTAILAALGWGDEVEYLGDASDDWAYLRVVDTGLEGYMAAQFLEPAN